MVQHDKADEVLFSYNYVLQDSQCSLILIQTNAV